MIKEPPQSTASISGVQVAVRESCLITPWLWETKGLFSEPRMPHLFAEGYGRRDSSKSWLLWELPVVQDDCQLEHIRDDEGLGRYSLKFP